MAVARLVSSSKTSKERGKCASDKARLGGYLEEVREIERRIQKIEEYNASGEAREVPDAIRKASETARKTMVAVNLLGTTIPHASQARFGAGEVLLRPASRGTGVIAGGGVRAVVEAAGVKDILSKSLGSDNILNVVQATFASLKQLQDYRVEAQRRGVDPEKLRPFWHQED